MTFHIPQGYVASALVLAVLAVARAGPAPGEACPPDVARSSQPPATRPADPLRETDLFPHEDTLCGPFSLYLACRSYGITNHEPLELARMAAFDGRSTSIEGLTRACDQISLHAIPARLNAPALARAVRGGRVRAIVLLRGGHFCYIDEASGDQFRITTYPFAPQWHDAAALSAAWAGPALLVSREPLPDLADIIGPDVAPAGPWRLGRPVGIGLSAAAVSYLGYLNVKGRRSRRTPQLGGRP